MEAIQEEQQQEQQPAVTTGVPCPKCNKVFSNQIGLRMHNLRKHTPGKGWDSSGNFKKKKRGTPWRPGQLQKFRATMRAKAIRKAKTRFPIVYPNPEKTTVHLPHINRTVEVLTMKYCPNCGEHIAGWRHS